MEYFIMASDFLKSKGSKDQFLYKAQLPQDLLILTPPKEQSFLMIITHRGSFKGTWPSEAAMTQSLPQHTRAGSDTQIGENLKI